VATSNLAAASGEASSPWYAGLTAKHWRVLWGSYLGWIFDGYEALCTRRRVAVRPEISSHLRAGADAGIDPPIRKSNGLSPCAIVLAGLGIDIVR